MRGRLAGARRYGKGGAGRGEMDFFVAARGAAFRNDKQGRRTGVGSPASRLLQGAGLFGVSGGEGGGGFLDAGAEFGGGEDFGGGAPAQDPLLGFGEGAEAEAEFEGAAGEVAHLLTFVPFAFADAFGDGGGEADDDAVVAGAAHDAEGVGEEFFRGEIGGAFEGDFGGCDVGDAREGEGAEGGALKVEGDEIPEVFAVGQVVGADAARGFFRVAGFAVGEGDFLRAEDGGA